MGMLNIKMWGSFPGCERMFKAQESGHAVAVDDAITFLQDVVLPAAIANDRACRADNAMPDDKFAEADKRKILETPKP